MKKLLFIFLLFSLWAQAQLPALTGIVSQQRTTDSSPFQLIDSVSITGLKSSSTKDPTILRGRTNETVTITAESFFNEIASSGLVTYSWSIEDASDGSVDITGTGETLDVSSLGIGDYNITVTATSLNALSRNYLRALIILPPKFTEGEADFVIDLDAVQADTFSPVLSGLTYDGGTNATFDFGEVSRPGFKIGVKGNFVGVTIKVNGLVGTDASRAVFQNVNDQVTLTGSGEVLRIGAGCNYVSIDGWGTTDRYGFLFAGRSDAGDQGQLLYYHGSFIKGIEVFGVDFNQTRTPSNTLGGACLQFSPTELDGTVLSTCNGNIGDPGYYTAEFFRVFGCRLRNTRDEGGYIGFNEDAQIAGYSPYRTGYVYFFRNIFDGGGRDPIQISSSDNFYCADNYFNNGGLEGNTDHNSSISFNDGNRGVSIITRNYMENGDILTSMQNGLTGNGSYYIYTNLWVQRATALGNVNQAVYYNIESDVACHAEFYNNTIIAPDVDFNPWCVQHDAPSSFADLTLQIKGNITSSGGSNDSPITFMRDIGNPSDISGWGFSNTQVRTASFATLKIAASTYRPNDPTSPAFGAGFDISSLPGGEYDIDGYPLFVNGGYVAGCFSSPTLFIL